MAIGPKKTTWVRHNVSRTKLKIVAPEAAGQYPGNATVMAYSREWMIRPSPLPRGARTNDADTFWIPRDMPVVRLRTKLGIVWCTPFYSVIPSLANTDREVNALCCLGSLTLEAVIADAKYRHELFFDRDLQLEPPRITKDTTSADAPIWLYVEWELEGLLGATRCNGLLVRPPTPLLPCLLNSLKRLCLAVAPPNFHQDIAETLNCERIYHDSDYLHEIRALIPPILSKHCHPRRHAWVQRVTRSFDSPFTDVAGVVDGFRITFGLLCMTVLDQINANIRKIAPALVASTSLVEYNYIENLITSGKCSLHSIRTWLLEQPRAEYLIWGKTPPYNLVSSPLLSRLISGLVSQLCCSSPMHLCPLFALDAARLAHLRERFEQYVRGCITNLIQKQATEFSSFPAGVNKEVLAGSIHPDCTIYRKVETRIMASLVYRVCRSLETCSSQPHSSAVTNSADATDELSSIENELRLLIRLHWSAAHPLYMQFDQFDQLDQLDQLNVPEHEIRM